MKDLKLETDPLVPRYSKRPHNVELGKHWDYQLRDERDLSLMTLKKVRKTYKE